MKQRDIFEQVAAQAVPPIDLSTIPGGDFVYQSLLDELVRTEAFLPLDVKKVFMASWMTDPAFADFPDSDEPEDEMDWEALRKLAQIEPTLDLDSLRDFDYDAELARLHAIPL